MSSSRNSLLAVAVAVALLALASPAPASAAFGYLSNWGSSGVGDGQFSGPAGIDVDASGNVWVAECNGSRVQKFSSTGTFLLKFGTLGTGNGQFTCARDVAVDATGVYVVDAGNNRVQKFTTAGAYVSQFNAADSGRAFNQPNGVATDGTNVFVTDTSTTDLAGLLQERVQRFSIAGVFQAQVGTAGSGGANTGQYNKMGGIAVGSSGIYVSDYDNNRIVRFTLAYVGANVWGSYGTGNGQFREYQQGVEVDGNGDVWVADMNNDRIQKFTSAGAFLGAWGTEGAGNLNFSQPMDIGAGPSGTIYIADTANDRIVKYGEGATALPTVTTGDATNIGWKSAALAGTVNPQGTDTSYRFEYGTTTSYAGTTATTGAGAGVADVAAATTIQGLTASTTYHYRLVALRGGSVVAVGADKTFTTAPDPGTAPGCSRIGHTIGVVGICADAMTYADGRWTASGNVILNEGVSVSGPVVTNEGLTDITSTGDVNVEVMRSPPVRIGTGTLHIDATSTTDAVSGHTGVAKLTIGNALTYALGGVPFVPLVTNYLDTQAGGGVIVTGRPSFDLLGPLAGLALPTGSFSLGIHRTASGPFKVLGGSIRWDGVDLGGNWKLGTFAIGYAEGPPSAWTFMGAAEFPFISNVGGLEISGATSGGSIDQIGVKLKTKGVPLGQTGVILDTFGGSLKGLSGGANNPLIVSAMTAGGWVKTNLPDPFGWVLHLKEVSLTINTSGSGTLAGELDVIDGEGRLVKGTAALTIQLAPSFYAAGTFAATFNAVAVSLSMNASLVMNTSHFTAQGSASGRLFGVNVGSGNGVISDSGFGATTRICIPIWGCSNFGYGMAWSSFSSFPPSLSWIGSDTARYVTVTASAAARRQGASAAAATTRSFSVPSGQPVLYLEARGGDASELEVISPAGVVYRPGAKRRDLYTNTVEGVTGIAVFAPKGGVWRLRTAGEGSTRVAVQTIRAIGRLKARSLTPRGSQKRPISKRIKQVRVRWSAAGLPADTRVAVLVSSSPTIPGTVVRSNVRARSGATTIKVSKLAPGANYVTLVPSSKRIRFDSVRFKGPIWKR